MWVLRTRHTDRTHNQTQSPQWSLTNQWYWQRYMVGWLVVTLMRKYPILWVFFNFEENFQEEKLKRWQNSFFVLKLYFFFSSFFFNEPPYSLRCSCWLSLWHHHSVDIAQRQQLYVVIFSHLITFLAVFILSQHQYYCTQHRHCLFDYLERSRTIPNRPIIGALFEYPPSLNNLSFNILTRDSYSLSSLLLLSID